MTGKIIWHRAAIICVSAMGLGITTTWISHYFPGICSLLSGLLVGLTVPYSWWHEPPPPPKPFRVPESVILKIMANAELAELPLRDK